MKLAKIKGLSIYLIFPRLKDHYEDGWVGIRRCKELSANTGFTRLYTDGELPNWFDITVLGFGIGLSWGGEEELW